MFTAKKFRKQEWGKIEFPGDEKPEEYYDPLASNEVCAIQEKFTSSRDADDYSFGRNADEKSMLDVREEILHVQELRLFDHVRVLESEDKKAAVVIGIKDDKWYKIAEFGDEVHFETTKKVAATKSDGTVGAIILWAVVLAIIAIGGAACVKYNFCPICMERVDSEPTVVSSMPGVDFNQVTPGKLAPIQKPAPTPEPEYFVYKKFTEEKVRLSDRFPNLDRVELQKQRPNIVRAYLKDGTAYETRILIRARSLDGVTPDQVLLSNSWVQIEFY